MRHRDLRWPSGTAVSVCLFEASRFILLCMMSIALTAVRAHGQTATLAHPRDLLAADPAVVARLLETARPTPVSAEQKAHILRSLPSEGEVTNVNGPALLKLAAVRQVLRAAERDAVYEIKVIDVPQASIGLHARAVLLISEAALALLRADELQAVTAHEVGHEYVWLDYERASTLGDRNRLKELELVCDGIAIVTLHRLGMKAARLMSGIEKISRFNHERLGTALNESSYPTLVQRRTFARAATAWAAGATSRTAAGVRRPSLE
jgi:hypothetical protein